MRAELDRRINEGADLGPDDDRTCEMAKYMLLIYGNEQRWDSMSLAERQELGEGHRAFVAEAGEAILAGGELDSTTMTTSVRAGSADRPAVTDGPFIETKEVLGGFYLLEAPDLDAAIALARRLPEVRVDHSGVEIRPFRGKA
jgi:hypothetical protein